jgi:hypothetical protein
VGMRRRKSTRRDTWNVATTAAAEFATPSMIAG